MCNAKNVLKAIDDFRSKKIMVIGDIIADEYVYGVTSRVSREAPVLILKFDSRTISLGGAGNAINNLHAMGADVIPVGVVGGDAMGKNVTDMIGAKGISIDTIVRMDGENTTTKTRILAGGVHTTRQQVIRIDSETAPRFSAAAEDTLLENIRRNIDKADGVIVSDYSHGVLSDGIIAFINEYSKTSEKVIAVDSRHNFFKYENVTAVTPNEPEVEELVHVSLEGNEHIPFAGAALLERIKCKSVLITRGKKGMVIFDGGNPPVAIPIYGSDEVADVTGAGDTVISAFALGLVSSLAPVTAAKLSNIAGGIVVMKSGTAVVTAAELKAAAGAYFAGDRDE